MISIKTGKLQTVCDLITKIPELNQSASINVLEERVQDKVTLILVAYVDSQAVGFKFGYELNSSDFYSWLGGVLPNYRQQGIARALLEEQERWARANLYQHIYVKSKNCFPNMLKMLISSNYQICDYENLGDINKNKIHFVKYL